MVSLWNWSEASSILVSRSAGNSQREGIEMEKFANNVKQFLVSEDGPTAVEYAVMLALIIVVCLAAIGTVGTATNAKFTAVGAALS